MTILAGVLDLNNIGCKAHVSQACEVNWRQIIYNCKIGFQYVSADWKSRPEQ